MKGMWGLDPFHLSKKQVKRAYEFISVIIGKSGQLEVGYVVNRTEQELSLAFDIPHSERFTSYPLGLLKNKLVQAGVPAEKLPIHLVDFPTLSTTATAEQLVKLSKKRNCDITIIFSQGGSAIRKLFLGSFAEAAVHLSDRKLLILNPHSKLAKKIKTVVYCYEPAEGSEKGLNDMIRYCREQKAKLMVFHAAQFIYAYRDKDSVPQVKQYKNKIKQMARKIEQKCASQNVQCKVKVSADFSTISERALKFAKRVRADLIAVEAKSGRGTALIGGSVTRQILRGSKIPVLVIR
jgi:nucleotide-binding universal stress UspA family protein